MSDAPRTLNWFGGKSTHGTIGLGKWVLSLLPPVVPGQTYVEAYAGMLGVLLARTPAAAECANDLDSRVYNFWRIIREQPDELARLLAATPHSRITHEQAKQILADPEQHDTMTQVWAFVVSVGQGIMAKVDSGWSNRTNAKTLRPRAPQWRSDCGAVTSLALQDRLRDVTLECRDGAYVAGYYADNPHAVIYCDPPYTKGAYGYDQKADLQALIDAVTDAKARVAISGYPDDPYDELDWYRYERGVTVTAAVRASQTVTPRTEVLWCNYDAQAEGAAGQQVLL